MKQILIAVLMIGCAGADGADGLDGATGARGPQGEQGVQGPVGQSGRDGLESIGYKGCVSNAYDVLDTTRSVAVCVAQVELLSNGWKWWHATLGTANSTSQQDRLDYPDYVPTFSWNTLDLLGTLFMTIDPQTYVMSVTQGNTVICTCTLK